MAFNRIRISGNNSSSKPENPVGSEFKLSCPKLAKSSEDLEHLQTYQDQIVGSLLPVLESIGFDSVNKGVRADYLSSPLPDSSYRLIQHDLANLTEQKLPERQRIAINFFLLGHTITDQEFHKVAGMHANSLMEAGIASGLILYDSSGLRLNNLALISSEQGNGKIIYCFADLPAYYRHDYKEQRVYSGADSYILNWRLMQIPSASGTIFEAGSGSGYQIFTMLNKHPDVTHAVGVEIDSRARNISKLNAILNGMHSKFSVFKTCDEAFKSLKGQSINLAFSNPPFISVPDFVEVAANEVCLMPEYCKPVASDNLVDVNRLFMKAGAGGKDGLAITKIFFESIRDKLAPNAELIFFSQFAIDSKKNPLAFRLDNQKQFSCEFEQLTGPGNFGTPFDWAQYLVGALETQHPSLKNSEFTLSVGVSAIKTFIDQGIAGFQSGFVTFKNVQSTCTLNRTDIFAPENITPWGIRRSRPAPLLGFRPDFVINT